MSAEADRLLAVLLSRPADRWIGLDVIRAEAPEVRYPATVLRELVDAGRAERASIGHPPEMYYRASWEERQKTRGPRGQRIGRGAARALQLAGATAPADVRIRDLGPLTGAEAVAEMTRGSR